MSPDEALRLLPAIFRRTVEGLSPEDRAWNPLGALLDVVAAMVTRLEEPLDSVARQLDPLEADARFVVYLTEWLGIPWLGELAALEGQGATEPPLLQMGALRMVVAAAPVISAWRGTSRGLSMILSLATSCNGFEVRETGRPYEMEIMVPARAKDSLALIDSIVEHEKPAHATWKRAVRNTPETDTQ